MKMKKITSLLLSSALVMSFLAGCGGSPTAPSNPNNSSASSNTSANTSKNPVQETVTLKMGHMRPDGSDIANACQAFADEVYEKTNGAYKIELYGANQLGDYDVVYERCSIGEVDLYLGSMSKAVDPSLAITSLPSLITSWDDAQKYLNTSDGTIANYVRERFAMQNLHLMAVHPMYFGVVALSKEPANWDEPTKSQGLKVRVSTNKAMALMAEAIGYTTAALPASEDFTNMQTGVTDGSIGGGAERIWSDLKDVAKYIIPCNTHFESQWLIMNEDLWNSLSPENQTVFSDAAKKMEENAFKIGPTNEQKYLDRFKEMGVVVYEVTPEIQEKYDAAIASAMESFVEELGDAVPVFNEVAKDKGLL